MPRAARAASGRFNVISRDAMLVGDVGGTNCRFALAYKTTESKTHKGGLELTSLSRMNVKDYPNFYEALEVYLSELAQRPAHISFALAGPKFNGAIKMTNVDWVVSEDELKRRFGFESAILSNDFAAMARGAALMPDDGFQNIISGKVNYSQTVAVLGPGTGLGVAGILPSRRPEHPLRILSTEGGYSAFAPQDELQVEILKRLMTKFDFVAAEHLLSGPGLLNIHQSLCEIRSENFTAAQPSDVVEMANVDAASTARDALDVFCNILGGFAGNTAYTLGASGGVIITGGVARHVAPFIETSDFEARFKSRGRASWFTQNIPVRLLTAHSVALYGAAAFIENLNG